MENKKYTGLGYYEHTDGGEYKGEFVDGKYHGFGIMTFSNNDLYEGDWQDGLSKYAALLHIRFSRFS